MRFPSSVLVVLALPLLVACNGTEEVGTEEAGTEVVDREDGADAAAVREIGVSARLDKDGKIKIDKDEAHHETAVVKPGDEIAWICRDCPDGTEFSVEDLHLVANVEQMVEVLSKPVPPDSPGEADEGDSREPYIDGEIALEWVDGELVIIRDPGGPKLVGWAPPAGFKAKGERIVTQLPVGLPHGVYKFTWKVRYQDTRGRVGPAHLHPPGLLSGA